MFWNTCWLCPVWQIASNMAYVVIRSWGWSPVNGISALRVRDSKSCSFSLLLTKWGYQEKRGRLQTRNRALTRHGICHTLILDFPASRAVRNQCLLLKSPHLWCSATAARAGKIYPTHSPCFSDISRNVCIFFRLNLLLPLLHFTCFIKLSMFFLHSFIP